LWEINPEGGAVALDNSPYHDETIMNAKEILGQASAPRGTGTLPTTPFEADGATSAHSAISGQVSAMTLSLELPKWTERWAGEHCTHS